jgi:hypothetical protein
MALNFDEYQFLKLIERSPTGNDGYSNVSQVVAPLFKRFAALNELIEWLPSEKGGKAKLTDKGKTVLEYSPCPE